MQMGTAQVPTLSELEAEIERRRLSLDYSYALTDAVGSGCFIGSSTIIALTRLTDTQKTQAALKVLNG